MSTNRELHEAAQKAFVQNYRQPPIILARGEGCRVWDVEGNEYLDFSGGIAVLSVGHAHPKLAAAIAEQASKLIHTSNLFYSDRAIELALELTERTGFDRVYFCNSGTEANEAAFKITRRTGRTKIISTVGAFHGRSMGALAVTHSPKYREPFEPLPGDVIFVPYGDAEALAAAVDDTVAAVVLEPIQGENGVVVPPPDYLARARELCDRSGALLWIDEVQTGIGRTGSWLVHVDQGVRADVVTVAKGLGNGFPIGACLATGPAATLLGAGSHGSTFGGNPVAAIAGLAVLAVIERDGLLANATAMGQHLCDAVTGLHHPLVAGVRGRGLLRAIVLARPIAQACVDAALDAGFVINAPRPDVLRIAPPLIVTVDLIDSFVAALPAILDTASEASA